MAKNFLVTRTCLVEAESTAEALALACKGHGSLSGVGFRIVSLAELINLVRESTLEELCEPQASRVTVDTAPEPAPVPATKAATTPFIRAPGTDMPARHVRTETEVSDLHVAVPDGLTQCPACDAGSFDSTGQLRRHYGMSHAIRTCPRCGVRLIGGARLGSHFAQCEGNLAD
jgi:hypothetical protein